ncbi:conserved hypothetical protein [Hyella patelloides LEGE 07179]|uniref:Uncharacterized protein n=1 Tax=Hyella patelloides LEGE 07179 TaxID=945734 RepID=A0A563W4E3_9CYAN|nr:hypothetical protein [Hyella patelloides]VEP18536.1 conserved hypothetical protein [Hyella patelloides LEGE 07179]
MTALGVYDVGEDGLFLESGRTGVDVGLWDNSGTLLGQVLVSGGTTAPILDGFRYENLGASIDLTTGSFYRVAADMRDINGLDLLSGANPISPNRINPTQTYFQSSFSFPTRTRDNPGQVALGGNILFDNAASASVPFEFSPTLGLLLVGGLFGGRQMYRSYQNKKIVD